jgi:hypothetical protein
MCSTKNRGTTQITVFRYVNPDNLYRSIYSKLSTNFERCSNQFPDTVPSFISKPQLLKLGLFHAVYQALLSSSLTTIINELRIHLVAYNFKMNSN